MYSISGGQPGVFPVGRRIFDKSSSNPYVNDNFLRDKFDYRELNNPWKQIMP